MSTAQPNRFWLRPAEVSDAEQLARCHLAALVETYRGIMPTQFGLDRASELAEEIEELRLDIGSGRDRQQLLPGHRHYLIAGVADRVVGLAAVGPGVREWEADRGLPEPPAGVVNLDKLYVESAWHGTGVGQALLEAALPQGMPAWLWIVNGNDRAASFYRRNGFRRQSADVSTGPSWYCRQMHRMWRPPGGSDRSTSR